MRKDWDNGIHELKPKFVYLYVKDKKNEQFQNYCNHFWGIRYVNLLFKKDCKGVEFLTKIYVFLYIMVDHKNGEGNKQKRSWKYMQKGKKTYIKKVCQGWN